MTEEKRKPFAKEFVSLGVMVSLGSSHKGKVLLKNKPGRVEGIRFQVDEIIRCGKMGFKDALSVKGKTSYAEGQIFGRVAAPLSQMLSRWSPYPLGELS